MKHTIVKVQGETQHNDLEGEFYTIKTSQGAVYKLEGGGPDLYHPALRVEIQGQVEEHGFGIGFGTPTLKVLEYKIKK